MKILQLTPRFPYPMDDGGKIGIGNIFQEFSAQGNEVLLLSYNHEILNNSDIATAKKFGSVRIISHSTRNTVPRLLFSLIDQYPLYLRKHINKNLINEITNITRDFNPDVIHADHTCMGPIAIEIKKLLKVPFGLRLHNIEWTIWQRYADEINNPLKKYYISRQARLLKVQEAKIIGQADIAFPITSTDLEKASSMAPGANLAVSGPGIDESFWITDENIERRMNEIVIATTYHWRHNVNGLKWFIDEVFPGILGKIPDATLKIIGKEAPDWLRNITRQGIQYIGYVDDVRPYLNSSGIYIAPLFVGSGIRIKILEAMAMELPVVATRVAAEGINCTEEEGLFVKNSPKDFAETIINLMSHPDVSHERGRNARNFALKNFSWKINARIMIQEYEKITSSLRK